MGDGFAVVPSNASVFSPVSGTITSVFETKHAIGILSDTGLEVLVHMGLDTVELKGEPFTVHVKEGDTITPDTLLAEINLTAVKESGRETDIIVAMTNAEKVDTITLQLNKTVTAHDRVGEVILK